MKVLASPLLYEWGAVMKTAVVFESTVCNFKLRIQAAGIWSNEMIEDGSQCDDAPQKTSRQTPRWPRWKMSGRLETGLSKPKILVISEGESASQGSSAPTVFNQQGLSETSPAWSFVHMHHGQMSLAVKWRCRAKRCPWNGMSPTTPVKTNRRVTFPLGPDQTIPV